MANLTQLHKTWNSMWTEHLVARTFFSVLSVLVVFRTCWHSSYVHTCVWLKDPGPDGSRLGRVANLADWNQETSLRHSARGDAMLAIWPTPLLRKGFEPKTCIDVSSTHTPMNYPSRRTSFNIENDLATSVAASDNSDVFP